MWTAITMIDVEAGVKWAEGIALDNSHGYSQPHRLSGIDYDCSSLVGTALVKMGFDYPAWCPSTRAMDEYIEACGWTWHNGTDGITRGDVLWKSGHTALATSANTLVEALRSETHSIDGEYGDQDGQEIRFANINYTTWAGYWSYPKEDIVTNEDIERFWSYQIQGVQARDRIYGMDSIQLPAIAEKLNDTSDPTGRDINLDTHDHVKWIGLKQSEMAEQLERMNGNFETLLDKLNDIVDKIAPKE